MYQPIARNVMNDWAGRVMHRHFRSTAAFNFGVNNFFAKWLKDVAADQVQMEVCRLLFQMYWVQMQRVQQAGPMQPLLFHGICTWPMVIKKYWKISTRV